MKPTHDLPKDYIDVSEDQITTMQIPSSDPALWNLQNANETSIIIRNGPVTGKLVREKIGPWTNFPWNLGPPTNFFAGFLVGTMPTLVPLPQGFG